jgi:hypothetical protein
MITFTEPLMDRSGKTRRDRGHMVLDVKPFSLTLIHDGFAFYTKLFG